MYTSMCTYINMHAYLFKYKEYNMSIIMNVPLNFRLGSTDADSKYTYDTIWTWQYIKL